MRIERSAQLSALPGLNHGFFGRDGGVSTGLYASLNAGLGSGDDPAHVAENRSRIAGALDVQADHLLTLYQIHSPKVEVVSGPWPAESRPQADGMVTTTRGLALGALAADCTPVLFADAEAGVIGACHAGWKGALGGVAEATIDTMVNQGARRDRIVAAIGPTIRQPSYEVGDEFRARFVEANPQNTRWFAAGKAPDKFQFDLPGYLTERLGRTGIAAIDDLKLCTYADPGFFSFRRTTHRGEPDYGRNISAIALIP